MRRAKIVCTLGPATAAPERILELERQQPKGRHVRTVRMLAAGESATAKASVAMVGTIVGAR